MTRRRSTAAAVAVLVAATTAGCGGGGKHDRTVTVFAAASLTEAFTALGHAFEVKHPGTKVVFDFGPSSGLATQIVQGAPADVFASASTKNMDQVQQAGEVADPTPFAKNVMEIAVPPGNPAHVAAVADLAKRSVKVALCQAQVPCGATAAKVLANARVHVSAVTQEVDVKSVLAKVTLGEVDAGIVYVTDVRAAGAKVRGVPIPAAVNASTTYPIGVLAHAPHAAGARSFVDFVLSSAGAAALVAAGFEKP